MCDSVDMAPHPFGEDHVPICIWSFLFFSSTDVECTDLDHAIVAVECVMVRLMASNKDV